MKILSTTEKKLIYGIEIKMAHKIHSANEIHLATTIPSATKIHSDST